VKKKPLIQNTVGAPASTQPLKKAARSTTSLM
jgi:hypothetical protein